MKRPHALAAALLSALALAACAPRQQVLQVPSYRVERVWLESLELPGPGRAPQARIGLSLQIDNPNPVPIRLSEARGQFYLSGVPAGQVSLPNLNLPAAGRAQQQALLTLPITLSNVAEFTRLGRGEEVPYRLDGSFTVDAGVLGRPTFGPLTLFQGVARVNRVLP